MLEKKERKQKKKIKKIMLNWIRTSIIPEWLENRNFESQVSVIPDSRDSWATGKDKARSHTKEFLNLPDKKKKREKIKTNQPVVKRAVILTIFVCRPWFLGVKDMRCLLLLHPTNKLENSWQTYVT
jgi:hypothetical protein